MEKLRGIQIVPVFSCKKIKLMRYYGCFVLIAVIREELARGFERLHKALRSALKKDASQLQLSLALESSVEEQSMKTTSSVSVLSPLPNPVMDVRHPLTADRPMSTIEELTVSAGVRWVCVCMK